MWKNSNEDFLNESRANQMLLESIFALPRRLRLKIIQPLSIRKI